MFDALNFIKLALSLGAFVFIALIGARNKRIVGLLLTFPVLNGIALLTSAAPFRVAEAIYLIVVFNCLLFWAAVATIKWLPPRPEQFQPIVLVVFRVAVWTSLWGVAAYFLTDHRDQFPSGTVLFSIQLVIAIFVGYCTWSRPPRTKPQVSTQSSLSVWLNWTVRIILFLIAYVALLYTAQNASDQKWTGMASALPLAGFFGLAYLSTENTAEQLKPIRDTVLLGPLLVIPFNWAFAYVVTAIPAGPLGVIHIAALLAAWAVALALVFWLVPAMEAYFDRLAK
jgi:hypothetical protein